MKRYKVGYAEVVNGIVELPEGAIPLQVGTMFTKPLSDPDCKIRGAIKYLIAEDGQHGVRTKPSEKH